MSDGVWSLLALVAIVAPLAVAWFLIGRDGRRGKPRDAPKNHNRTR